MKISYISRAILPSEIAMSVHIMKMCNQLSFFFERVLCIVPKYDSIRHSDIQNAFNFYNIPQNRFLLHYLPWSKIPLYSFFYPFISVSFAKFCNVKLIITRDIRVAFFCVLFRINFLLEIHSPFESIKNKKLSKFFSFIFRMLMNSKYFVKCIVISEYLLKYFRKKFNISRKKIIFLHDAADPLNFSIKRVNFAENSFNVGYIGNIYKGRGIELIYRLAKELPNIEFHIIGGSKLIVENWRKKSKKNKNLHFYGFLEHNKINQYLISFDVLIAPYYKKVGIAGDNFNSIKWTSPLKIFEYMSAMKPILTSKYQPFCKIFKDGENAILCDPNNIGEWIHALNKLKREEYLRNKLSVNSYNLFLEKYTWKKRVISLLKSIKNLEINNMEE